MCGEACSARSHVEWQVTAENLGSRVCRRLRPWPVTPFVINRFHILNGYFVQACLFRHFPILATRLKPVTFSAEMDKVFSVFPSSVVSEI